jgi:hypothetical protein
MSSSRVTAAPERVMSGAFASLASRMSSSVGQRAAQRSASAQFRMCVSDAGERRRSEHTCAARRARTEHAEEAVLQQLLLPRVLFLRGRSSGSRGAVLRGGAAAAGVHRLSGRRCGDKLRQHRHHRGRQALAQRRLRAQHAAQRRLRERTAREEAARHQAHKPYGHGVLHARTEQLRCRRIGGTACALGEGTMAAALRTSSFARVASHSALMAACARRARVRESARAGRKSAPRTGKRAAAARLR